ncbi:LacI family DNA-binding transcriptional regulator [Allonocardiopsis opalescens]|uniref:LacI family transcriptional regulator n=1 Tax=Allonocardiopsis opalescens TaxID=1144618 RepID=A0A2T0Q0F9_9ACTN|nr:LacI family DNA-binding transcriptional regulator [Allonocardiopsis opalescens]PRX97195.1 LacI family transcriptional regulator [Allonocardiopsis opalescens]
MTTRQGRPPTLEEVAVRAGVGRGTVSRVINGSPRVSERARTAVLKAIDDLGYVPNRAARTLVTRQSDTVALVVSQSGERLFAEPFYAGIVRGISATLAAADLQLLLMLASSSAELARMENYLTAQHVAGAMLLSLHRSDRLPQRLEAAGVPCVLGGQLIDIEPGTLSQVDVDNNGGARSAVQHLIGTGRRRIATITGALDMLSGLERLRGYQAVLEEADLPADLVATGDYSYASALDGMRQLLETEPELDAVFAASDPMAMAAIRVLRDRGRRVPDDVAVVGFDDSDLALHAEPPLTTVHQPIELMGSEMARLLVDRVHGEREKIEVLLDTHLVVRASA